jgi:alkylation response protein AidB-like acyl-CoA dehydrogenase
MTTLILSDEQRLIQSTIGDLLEARVDVSRLVQYRDDMDPVGYSKPLWTEMAESGWLGLRIPETFGGMALGFVELSLLFESIGGGVMPEPFLSTVLMATEVLGLEDNPDRKAQLLPSINRGQIILSVAHEERKMRYERVPQHTWIEESDGGQVLSGEKVHVLDGHVADGFFVTARHKAHANKPDYFSIVYVDGKKQGVSRDRQWRMDGRNAAVLHLDRVVVEKKDMVGPEGKGGTILNHVYDMATIGLASEMLGGMDRAFQLTLDYLRTREQFGVPIGTFQALQHRAARMFQKLTMTRSAVMAASARADGDAAVLSEMASLAKVLAADAYMFIANEAVQMHGGIGMTDEHSIGWYLKRARGDQVLFGDSAWHRDRWATLHGY